MYNVNQTINYVNFDQVHKPGDIYLSNLKSGDIVHTIDYNNHADLKIMLGCMCMTRWIFSCLGGGESWEAWQEEKNLKEKRSVESVCTSITMHMGGPLGWLALQQDGTRLTIGIHTHARTHTHTHTSRILRGQKEI